MYLSQKSSSKSLVTFLLFVLKKIYFFVISLRYISNCHYIDQIIFFTAEGRKSEPSMKRKHVTVSSDEESDSDIRHHNKEKGKKVKYNEKPISEAYGGFK